VGLRGRVRLVGAVVHEQNPQAARARSLDAARIACEPAERRRIIDHFDWHDSWIAVGRRALEIYPT
jgi:hypothetical protein